MVCRVKEKKMESESQMMVRGDRCTGAQWEDRKWKKREEKIRILQCLFRAAEVQISIFLGVIFTSGTNRLYREQQALSKT